MFLKALLVVVISYFIGSVSTAIIMSRRMKLGDVREKGSGNAGATNMARVYGMKAGIAVLLGDMLKALVCTAMGSFLLGMNGAALAGCGCIVGHCFPAYYGFRGGKGVSVSAVLGFCVDWRVGLIMLAVFAVVAVLSKKVSLGSVTAALAVLVSALLLRVDAPSIVLAAVLAVLVVFQHRGNIRRLINGTEPDFCPGSGK